MSVNPPLLHSGSFCSADYSFTPEVNPTDYYSLLLQCNGAEFKAVSYEDFVADLSFLGFDEPVFVSSYAVGNLTKATDSIAHVMTQTKKGIKEKEIKGDCLALFVTAGIPTAEDYRKDVVNGIDSRSYIVVLDYGAGKTYKAQTYFLLHNIQNFHLNLPGLLPLLQLR